MALELGSHGFSIISQAFPPALTVIQGGDLLNLTFQLDYNGTQDVLVENSTACHELNNRTLLLNFVITLPVVFDILYPTNARNHTGSILTDFSNCSVTPSLEINSMVVASDIPGFHNLRFDVVSPNVSWTARLDVQLRLLHSARTGDLLNITGNATIANETKQFNVASYRTPVPGNIQLEVTTTSIPETPNVTVTSEEEVTISATFQLPRITADLLLLITLPTFRNSTPMKFLHGSVKSLSQGVVSQMLGIGSPPQYSISSFNMHQFPHSLNVAKFLFGETVNNNANLSFNGTITVEVTGRVDSSEGVYVPETEGNVTCVLMYHSGINVISDETFLTLQLGQPQLERHFVIQGSKCCYEGNDKVELTFEVKNPTESTSAALNVTIDVNVLSADIAVHNLSVELCGNITLFSNVTGNQSSAYIEMKCINLNGTDKLTNSGSGLTVNLPR